MNIISQTRFLGKLEQRRLVITKKWIIRKSYGKKPYYEVVDRDSVLPIVKFAETFKEALESTNIKYSRVRGSLRSG